MPLEPVPKLALVGGEADVPRRFHQHGEQKLHDLFVTAELVEGQRQKHPKLGVLGKQRSAAAQHLHLARLPISRQQPPSPM